MKKKQTFLWGTPTPGQGGREESKLLCCKEKKYSGRRMTQGQGQMKEGGNPL